MALQNRVTPAGELICSPHRGQLMGNRGGRLHDPETKRLGTRRWASRQWISCRLEFNGRKRVVWGYSYTELFFVDEVTALAAGHRPCFECRRHDAVAFAAAMSAGLKLDAVPRAGDIDRVLHAERLDHRAKRSHAAEIADLPDGAIFDFDGTPHVARGCQLWPWSASGYAEPIDRPVSGQVMVLTPPAVIAALRAGYQPLWHSSLETQSR